MHFINEKNDIARFTDFVKDFPQALLKFAPVLGARHHSGHGQRNDALVPQIERHVSRRDGLRQPFDDCGLPDARLSDQNRIVFPAPRKNLNDAPNLALTPDNRVQLIFRGKLAERAPVLGQQRRSRSARAALLFVSLVIVVHHLKDGLPDEIEVGAQRRQHPRRRIAALPRQRQQNMFRADIVML